VLNADDERVRAVIPELDCHVIAFGRGDCATLRFSEVSGGGPEGGTRFTIRLGDESAVVDSPVPGEHTVPGIAAAIGVAVAFGVGLREAAEAIAASGLTGRVRRLDGRNGSLIIDDRYNSSPASLAGALAMLGATHRGGHRYALLGKMAELGEHEAAEHRAAGRAAAASCDALYAVGEACRAMVEGARAAGLAQAYWFADKDEAARELAARLATDDTVLVKASRSQEFETLLPFLEAGR